MRIPFNKPTLVGSELEYVRQAVSDGHMSAAGPFGQKVTALLMAELGSADVLLTTSCTDALEMAALLLDLGPGDKVIVPSFTFVSTALAFARTGAEIVFADIEEERLGLDPDHVGELLDDRVRVVVPVHYAGIPCRIEDLLGVVPADVAIVEDNAHGLFGSSRGRALGSFGRFSATSFHETKNFISGEGGALAMNQPGDVARARIIFDKGTNRQAFLAGEVDKYTWQDIGSSFGLSDVLAAFLYGQLERRDEVLRRRQALFDTFDAALRPLADRHGLQLPTIPADATCGYHMYYVILPDRVLRDACLEALRRRGIGATFHYVPLHSAPGARRFTSEVPTLPVTDKVSSRLLRLPFYTSMPTETSEEIVHGIISFLEDQRV